MRKTILVIIVLLLTSLVLAGVACEKKQPKKEKDTQETEKDEGLSPEKDEGLSPEDEYLLQYGTCPPGYDLIIGQRRPPGVFYEEVTKRLEEATKRLEETPENDTEATIRAIKELEEATLLYHSRCEERE